MKRIQPVSTYRESEGYPAVSPQTQEEAETHGEDETQQEVSRRGFLRGALGAGALGVVGAAGGGMAALVLGEGEADARGQARRAYRRLWFQLVRPHFFPGGRYHVSRLLVQSRDRRLLRFVGDPKERAGLDTAIRAVLTRASSADLVDQKKLARLSRRVGKAIAARYQRRARRRAARPLITLAIERRRRPPLPGGLRPPRPPHPAPRP